MQGVIFGKAASFPFFLLERLLLSVVVAGFSGVDTSIIFLSCKRVEREGWDSQKVFGIYNAVGMAGLLLASFVYSSLIDNM